MSNPAAPLDLTDAPGSSAVPEAAPARRGAMLYLMASLAGQVVALVRYVILARMLGPDQLGLAATLVVTAAFFDLISETGSDRFLIQDRHGNQPEVQDLVQLVYVTRGVMIAVALAVFAIPLSMFYRAPQLAWGFVILGLIRVVLGFTHLDMRRMQRELDFRPEAVNTLISETAGLAATGVAAWLTRDFTSILYGLAFRAVVSVAYSHLSASRRYGLKWSREHGPRLTRFAIPLVMTGLMLFVGTQGDRMMVGNRLGPRALGEYSAIMLLIYSPAAVILRYMHAIYVPLVAVGRDDRVLRNTVSDRLGGQTVLLGLAMSAGFALVAPVMIPLLYGGRFAQSALLVGLVGILVTTRFLINWPTTVALSMGRSRTVLFSNLSRLSVFPLALAGMALFGGLAGLVSGFVGREMLSVGISLALLNRDAERPMTTGFDRFAIFISGSALIVAWDLALAGPVDLTRYLGLSVLTLLLAVWLVRRERFVISESLTMAETTATAARRRLGLSPSRRPT